MKYSLRSLMLDAVIAVPFLVAGAFAVCCIREVIQRYEEAQIIDGIRYVSDVTELPESWSPAPNPPKP